MSELGDQLSYFYQISLIFKYLCGNPSSKFLAEVGVSEHRKLGRDYMSLDYCTCLFFSNQNALPAFIPNSPAALLLPSKPFQIYTTAYLFSKIMAYKHCVTDLHEAVTGAQRA